MSGTDPLRPATVDETLARVRASCAPLEPEHVALTGAVGRVLRETVVAPEDQPPFDRSSMDGYAVRLDDDSARFRVVEHLRAGDWKPRELQRGEAAQIATGAALPSEGLQVLMKEDVQVEGKEIVVRQRDAERHIRFRGEDARAGAPLVEAGTRLGPGALALLASVGCTQPSVTRLPRVWHATTGNELVPPDQTPGRGQIRDSNSTLVRAFLARWGVAPRQLRLPEDETTAKTAIADSQWPMAEVDLLLISGGASVGEHDFTRRLLEALGYSIRISRTTTRPGKPLLFATREPQVAFGLPGNPLAHFVCLNLYVRAALHSFSGVTAPDGFAEAVLAQDFDGEANARETLWPAMWRIAANAAALTPLPWRSSGDLTVLATANALVRIPPGCGKLPRGATLPFQPTAPWL